MPKMKTHSSAKKRFKLTAKGKVRGGQAYTSHIAGSKTKKQKRNLRGTTIMSAADTARIKRLLCK